MAARPVATGSEPTLWQRVMASDWVPRVWQGASVAAAIVIGLRWADASLQMLSSFWSAALLLVIVVVSGLAGFFVAGLAGVFVLSPLYMWRVELNGGPFEVGDRVRVLAGPNRGKEVRVYSRWQGASVRVDCGPEAADAFGDVIEEVKLQLVRPTDIGRADGSGPGNGGGAVPMP